MEQEKIRYSDVMDLGFKEEIGNDSTYFKKYGFDYAIITKYLTKKIYLDWAKETQLCEMVRIDSPKNCNIKAKLPIRNLEHLKEVVNFFSDEEVNEVDYTKFA